MTSQHVGIGGGVLLYVSDELKCVVNDKLNSFECESVWVQLQEVSKATVTLGML